MRSERMDMSVTDKSIPAKIARPNGSSSRKSASSARTAMAGSDGGPAQRERLFTQVYPDGWQALGFLAAYPLALQIFTTLARHCDERGIIMVAAKDLQGIHKTALSSIYKALGLLAGDNNLRVEFIRKRRYGNQSYYALNPRILWKSGDGKQNESVFVRGLADVSNSSRSRKTGRSTTPIPVLAEFDWIGEMAGLREALAMPDTAPALTGPGRKRATGPAPNTP